VQTSANTVSFVSIVFTRWQHCIRQRRALSGSDKESFNPILDPDADLHHHQNLIISMIGKV